MISSEITLILPTKNHEKLILNNISSVIQFLEKNFSNFEILIISNGSHKTNLDLISSYKSKYIKHFVYEYSGKGFAVRKGIENSTYKYLLICDADFSVDIKFIDNFFNDGLPLSSFVVGSRKLSNSQIIKTPLIRTISGGIFTYLTKHFLKIKFTDTQCGFKLIDKIEFKNSDKYFSDDFFYDVELFLLAKKNSIKISEVPVRYVHNDKSSINIIFDSFRMFIKLVSAKYRYR